MEESDIKSAPGIVQIYKNNKIKLISDNWLQKWPCNVQILLQAVFCTFKWFLSTSWPQSGTKKHCEKCLNNDHSP